MSDWQGLRLMVEMKSGYDYKRWWNSSIYWLWWWLHKYTQIRVLKKRICDPTLIQWGKCYSYMKATGKYIHTKGVCGGTLRNKASIYPSGKKYLSMDIPPWTCLISSNKMVKIANFMCILPQKKKNWGEKEIKYWYIILQHGWILKDHAKWKMSGINKQSFYDSIHM